MGVACLLWRKLKLTKVGRNLTGMIDNQLHQQYAAEKSISLGHPDTRTRQMPERIDFGALPG